MSENVDSKSFSSFLQINIINVFPHPKSVVECIGGDALRIAIDENTNWV